MSKRFINRRFVIILSLGLLIALSIYKIPHFLNVTKLEELGYSPEAITAIYQKGLRSPILKNAYYSDYLNSEVTKDTFNADYLELYVVSDHLDENDFALFDRLKAFKGYTLEELLPAYDKLDYYRITPLLVFDKMDDLGSYIGDCSANTYNEDGRNYCTLTNDYLHPYVNAEDVKDPSSVEVYVSVKSSLGEYAPAKLVMIPQKIASPDIYLESKALQAFQELTNVMEHEGLGIYAVGAYRSFTEQKQIYDGYDSTQEADANVIRPGYHDAQTGLGVSIVSDENESLAQFKDTKAYQWLKANAHKYGFIERYPLKSEALTFQQGRPYYWRYVGTELATKIYDSHLTFDEYYMLKMAE